MRSRAERIRGFAIVSAIFILVVLAALGAFIVNISTSQQIGSALDVQGVRAYQAARAGLEWGLYQVQATAAYNFSYGPGPGPVGTANPNTRACPTSPTSFVPTAVTLADFTVTVDCEKAEDTINGGPTIYSITATACNQPLGGWTPATTACPNTVNPGPLYVERRVSVTF
ncbi:pilus assembly PilX N-terminal domain-containing protein [Sulfuritalea sp.]|uniref:pilus assembly PilX N-terminal domain-containing protein n=1 Tax=Sulfuritalea sp. TaxID=2480090 RepID=UPI00286E156D|nr:pilus assembly PilX N-terminal domain-containing protein [Sulfuritalea sp.]